MHAPVRINVKHLHELSSSHRINAREAIQHFRGRKITLNVCHRHTCYHELLELQAHHAEQWHTKHEGRIMINAENTIQVMGFVYLKWHTVSSKCNVALPVAS